jgi:3-hydroxyacyl-CoA dehydrogenase
VNMTRLVRYQRKGTTGVITVNNPPVNALSLGVPQGIMECLEQGINDPAIKAFIIMGAGSTFIAGADIREFGKPLPPGAPTIRDLIPLLEKCTKPVVATIHGTALGGGLETALGCHFRCAVADAKLGLPEVKLGLLPGGGGTQRLPRLIGVEPALDLMISGEHISAARALSLGLVDRILDGDLLTGALEFAEQAVEENRPLRVVSQTAATFKASSVAEYFAEIRAGLQKKRRDELAPFLIVDCVEAAVNLPIAEGLAIEERLFDQCVQSPQSRALIHLFFSERAAAKVPGADSTSLRKVGKVAIVGAGTMGGGIAMCFTDIGIPVKILEIDQAALDRGLGIVRKNYEISAKKGKITPEQVNERMSWLKGVLSYDELADADLVIEAAFENMDVKKSIFAKLDRVCKAGAILATNTSTLDVNKIAAATKRPRDVVGLHFFSPANIMRLLEIVRGRETAGDVIATVIKMTRKIRKIPVVVGVCFGFVGNRMLEPYMRESMRLLLEGATPAQVDRVMTGFGFAMGVLSVVDLAGNDITYQVRQSRREEIARDPSYQIISDRLYELGRNGQKTKRGFYIYEGRERIDDPEVVELAEKLASELGIERRVISDEEILERCLYTLINEGADILHEGIAYRSGDCDLVWVNGYGFPAWRGGPMQYADEIGLDKVFDSLNKYREKLGAYGAMWFNPSPLLANLVKDGRKFADSGRSSGS